MGLFLAILAFLGLNRGSVIESAVLGSQSLSKVKQVEELKLGMEVLKEKGEYLRQFINSGDSAAFSTDRTFKPRYKTGSYIDVDISEQVLRYVVDSKVVKKFKCSTGSKEEPTPLGEFRIKNRSSLYRNINGDILPYWQGFYGQRGGVVIYGDFKELGQRKSRGCVRLAPAAAKFIFNQSRVGTKVFIHK